MRDRDNRPLPLVPAEVDIRDFAFMPLDVSRLRDSDLAANETPEACWAAVLLWAASWHQIPAASIPNDDRWIAKQAGYAQRGKIAKEWSDIRSGALRNWVECSDGRLYHPVVAEKALIAWASKQRRMAKFVRRLEMESGLWSSLRGAVFARDDYTCRYCGSRGGRLECDHVFPLSKGGVSAESNLVTSCLPCNRKKGTKTLQEWLQ